MKTVFSSQDIYIEGMWLRYGQKFSRNGFTCAFATLGFLPRMKCVRNSLLLAYLEGS